MDPTTIIPDSPMANAALKSLIDAVAFAAESLFLLRVHPCREAVGLKRL
jgi:hypothetical protein